MPIVRRPLAPLLLLAAIALATAHPASANGIGDLYVTTAGGVDELNVASAELVNRVQLKPRPIALAFTPDGRDLYVGGTDRRLARIDIETLAVAASVDVGGSVVALAHPRGSRLVIARSASKSLSILEAFATKVAKSSDLPAVADLLAADRRDPRVAAARTGEDWLAVLDPATGKLATTRLRGAVAAIAIDHDRGAVYVASLGPDEVVRYDLDDLRRLWRVGLPGRPVGIAALRDGVVVAGADRVWSVDSEKATTWGEPSGTILALAASDDGGVAYAIETSDRIEVFGRAGEIVQELQLDEGAAPTGLAPVPGRSSGGVDEIDASGAAGAPRTDTLPGAIFSRSGSSGSLMLAGLLSLCVLGLCAFVWIGWGRRA